MGLLCWDKPKKARTTKEHNDTFVADGAPPGIYVPNMSDEDQEKWKAKKVKGKDPRIEIRRTVSGEPHGSEKYGSSASVLLVARWSEDKQRASVTFSANGKAEFDLHELGRVLAEAEKAVFALFMGMKYNCPKCEDTGTVRWKDNLGWQSYPCNVCGGKDG